MIGKELDEAESKRLMDMSIDPTNAYFFDLNKELSWKDAHGLWADSRELVNAEATRLSDADFESDPELDHKIGLDSFDHVRGHLG